MTWEKYGALVVLIIKNIMDRAETSKGWYKKSGKMELKVDIE